MKNKKYVKPIAEFTEFECEDIIQTSVIVKDATFNCGLGNWKEIWSEDL